MSATFGILFESGKEMEPTECTFLRTLGHPVLRRGDGSVVEGLRRKDLALLAYLCVEGDRPFSRSHLAALLWGESPEEKARHSLTQALRRAGAAVGRRALVMERDTVRWTGAAACDAQLLLEADPRLDERLTIYEGPFLEGFEAGFGSQEFSAWADARRAELRRAAVRWLDRAGEVAERARDWERALRLGERSVQIDREWEGGHRRVMRALLERGERNLALRHFREFARWLTYEVGGHPDPETMALADLIRSTASLPAHTPPASPPAVLTPPRPVEPPPADTAEPASLAEEEADDAEEEVPVLLGDTGERVREIGAGEEIEEGGAAEEAVSPPPAAGPSSPRTMAEAPRWTTTLPHAAAVLLAPFAADDADVDVWMTRSFRRLFAAAAVLALTLLAAGPHSADVQLVAGNLVVIQARGQTRAYLVYGNTLWGFPDAITLTRCLAGRQRVHQVRVLPPWPRRMLPSVRTHPWLCATLPAGGFVPADGARHGPNGCGMPLVPPAAPPAVHEGMNSSRPGRRIPRPAVAAAIPARASRVRGAGPPAHSIPRVDAFLRD